MSKWDVEMIRSQLTHSRNEITIHTIKRVLPSPYVLAKEYFDIVQKGDELRGGERYFVGTMNDGTSWQFLSIASAPLFITMPSGYSTGSIARVEAGAHLSEPHLNIPEDEAKGFYGVYGYAGEIFREMPCFWCFSDKITVGEEVLHGWEPED